MLISIMNKQQEEKLIEMLIEDFFKKSTDVDILIERINKIFHNSLDEGYILQKIDEFTIERRRKQFKPNLEIMALMDEFFDGEKSLEEVYHIVKESLETKTKNFLSGNGLPVITIDEDEPMIKIKTNK